VADFAPARAADASGFADGEVREVVMQNEFLFGFAAGVGIESCVSSSAERGQRKRLGFAAAENAEPCARGNRPIRLKIDAQHQRCGHQDVAVVQNQTADAFLLDVVKCVVDDKVRDLFRAEFSTSFAPTSFWIACRRLRGEFAGREQRGHKTSRELLGFLEDFVRNDLT